MVEATVSFSLSLSLSLSLINTLAYNASEFITTVKSFIVKANVENQSKLFFFVTDLPAE
jgi:hypothetical protein